MALHEVGDRIGGEHHDDDRQANRRDHDRQVPRHADGRQDGVEREDEVEQEDLSHHAGHGLGNLLRRARLLAARGLGIVKVIAFDDAVNFRRCLGNQEQSAGQ